MKLFIQIQVKPIYLFGIIVLKTYSIESFKQKYPVMC